MWSKKAWGLPMSAESPSGALNSLSTQDHIIWTRIEARSFMSGLMTPALLKMGKTAMLERDGMTLLAADKFKNTIISMVSMS